LPNLSINKDVDSVQQVAKFFAERLNQALDDLDVPAGSRERAASLAKLIDIPKPQAWSLIDGHLVPDDDLLQQLADVLEVDAQWLLVGTRN
jgi:hypothetical protein